MDTGIIPLVKQVVIIFSILIAVFIILSFGMAKIKSLITGKKPPKTGPELYAAQMAMQKNPYQPQVKKARIPSKEKEPAPATPPPAPKTRVQENYAQENAERQKPAPPNVRRNDEARRSRVQSRVSMNMVQQSAPKRNIFEVVNTQQANYRNLNSATISYTPQSKPNATQVSMRNQTLTASGANPTQNQRGDRGKVIVNFK
jgi:hypothetical protein